MSVFFDDGSYFSVAAMEFPPSVRDGRLYVEELACAELAKRFGTPLYVMSEMRLRTNVRRLQASVSAGWPLAEARLLPSVKANPTLATRAALTSEGTGCDTFGEAEFEAALRAGVPPALISVNGASTSPSLIRRAVAAGARTTLDSARELPITELAAAEAGNTAQVRIRPRLDGVEAPSNLTPEWASIWDVSQACKAGVPIDETTWLGRSAMDSPHVELVGVQAHLSRHTADLSLLWAQIESLADLLAELSTEWGRSLPAEIDVGGGWPSRLDPPGRRPLQARARTLLDDVLGRDIVPERLRNAGAA